MEIVLIVATIIGGIVGLVQSIKWLRKPEAIKRDEPFKEDRPFLDMEVLYQGGSSVPLGRSPNAKLTPGQNYFTQEEALKIFELERQMLITIVNNSNVAALYLKIYLHNDSFKPQIEKLKTVNPIKAHESIALKGIYRGMEERLSGNRTRETDFPSPELRDNLQLLLEYQNSNRKTFYTLFKGSNNQNEYLEDQPAGFDG